MTCRAFNVFKVAENECHLIYVKDNQSLAWKIRKILLSLVLPLLVISKQKQNGAGCFGQGCPIKVYAKTAFS